jgi:hypothetical protein
VLWAFGICQKWVGLRSVGLYTRGGQLENPFGRCWKSHVVSGDTRVSGNLVTPASYVESGQEGSTYKPEPTRYKVGST